MPLAQLVAVSSAWSAGRRRIMGDLLSLRRDVVRFTVLMEIMMSSHVFLNRGFREINGSAFITQFFKSQVRETVFIYLFIYLFYTLR